MATFRLYNIQLLPLDTHKTPEVGRDGYRRLFQKFQEATTNSYRGKRMAKEAKPLIHDTFICPFTVHPDEKMAHGSFLKFHNAATVTEFYSKERLFEAERGTTPVSNQRYFRFIFDYSEHRLAIEENNNRLPSPDVMMETLEYFLHPLANRNFPDHVLTVNLISDEHSLMEALDPDNEFGPVKVKLVFPNSRGLNHTLRELKDNNVHHIEASVSPARGARINRLPKYIYELLEKAPDLGEATVVFFKKTLKDKAAQAFKRMTYSTKSHPRRITVRPKKDETEESFLRRVLGVMKGRAENERA